MRKILFLFLLLSSFCVFIFSPSIVFAEGKYCADNKCPAEEICATVTTPREDGTKRTVSSCFIKANIPTGASIQKTNNQSATDICATIPDSATRFPSSCVAGPTHAPTGITSCPSGQIPYGFGGQIIECRKPEAPLNLQASTPKPTPPPLVSPCKEGLMKDGKTTTTDPTKIVTCTTIDTAVGPINTKPEDFVKSIFGILLSLAGGVALVLIMISGYRLMVSEGNPEKVQAAREQLTSAIVGLLFVIFSITILQIIGVDILKIPGFGK